MTPKLHLDRPLVVLFNHIVFRLDRRRVGPLAQLRLNKGLGPSKGHGFIRRQAKGGGCGQGRRISNVLEPGLGGHNGKKIDRADAQHGDGRHGQSEIQCDGAPGLAQKPLHPLLNPAAQAGHHASLALIKSTRPVITEADRRSRTASGADMGSPGFPKAKAQCVDLSRSRFARAAVNHAV